MVGDSAIQQQHRAGLRLRNRLFIQGGVYEAFTAKLVCWQPVLRLDLRQARAAEIFLVRFGLITVASVMQFYAEAAMQLFLCRVLIGAGLGGDFSVGHAMLAKKTPGVLLGSFSVIWTFSYVAATFVGTICFCLN